LVHPENWDKEVALVLAKSENITLTDAWPLHKYE
jgi:tRNA 2-thiouridine synthesizing protein E